MGTTDSHNEGVTTWSLEDDNVDGLESLLALLNMMGFDATGASDGKAGLQVAMSFNPQVALLDLGLPGMNALSSHMLCASAPDWTTSC